MNQQDFGIKRVSVDSSGNEANGNSSAAAISGDGRFVAFESEADNLVAGDTNEVGDIFIHEIETGITNRVSVGSSGEQASEGVESYSMSADGDNCPIYVRGGFHIRFAIGDYYYPLQIAPKCLRRNLLSVLPSAIAY